MDDSLFGWLFSSFRCFAVWGMSCLLDAAENWRMSLVETHSVDDESDDGSSSSHNRA